jgi:hypothetical protein
MKKKFIIWLSIFLSLCLLTVSSLSAVAQEETSRAVDKAPIAQVPPGNDVPINTWAVTDAIVWSQTVASNQWYETLAAKARKEQQKVSNHTRPVTTQQTVGAAATSPDGGGDYSGDRFDRLAKCESRMHQDANDGAGHYSYFQWTLSTFHAAGGSGDPRDVDYGTQKGLAMSWAQQSNPYTQWPHCWPLSADPNYNPN